MNTTRITAFFAAASVTTLLVVGQFGLARHYDGEAALQLARQAAPQQAQASAAAARTPG